MANTEKILRKLEMYRKEPDIVQPLSNTDLADLVVVVLSQVRKIEKAIGDKKLDLDSKIGKDADDLVRNTERQVAQMRAELLNQIRAEITNGAQQLTENSTQLEKRVSEALENIKNGDDGIVTDAEIERAASIAASIIELPDFDALVSETITSDGGAVRDALELLQGDDRYKVEIKDVDGLENTLKQLAQVRQSNGGTIGKQQVYGFIRNAVSDGIISSSIESLDDIGDVTITSVADGQVVTWSDSQNKWVNAAPPGASGGEANTASNVGTAGVGVFKGKSLLDLEFKKINAGSAKITIPTTQEMMK